MKKKKYARGKPLREYCVIHVNLLYIAKFAKSRYNCTALFIIYIFVPL